MAFVRNVLGLAVGSVVAAACLGAAETPPATNPATATAPAAATAAEMKQWVAQLGAEAFADRKAATQKLRAAGKNALPALQEGTHSEDPEIKGQCQKLLVEIEAGPQQPVAVGGMGGGMGGGGMAGGGNVMPGNVVRIGGGNAGGGMIIVQGGGQIVIGGKVALAAGPGGKEVNVEENGKKVHIKEDGDGVLVEVTEAVNGKDKTTKYEAKTVKELEEKQPEGYKIYKKYVDKEAGAVRIQQKLIVGPDGVRQPAE